MAAERAGTRQRLSRIRVLARAVIRDGDRILVVEAFDPVKGQAFFVPLGGAIEFGERGEEAIRRELVEEIGATATRVHCLGALEAIFEYAGRPGHEIVLLYEVEVEDVPRGERFRRVDSEGECVWVPLATFRDGSPPLYPEGLLELLSRRRR